MDPDLEAILARLSAVNTSDAGRYIPPYGSHRPAHTSSILNPEISIVVAIEWDRSIAWNPLKAMMWTPYRWQRAKSDGYSRRIQFSQYVLLAKPYHPIFLDTLATIAELAEGDASRLGAVRLTRKEKTSSD